MTNIDLFNYSKEHPTPIIDSYYRKGRLVITDDARKKNPLMLGNAELLELISVFSYFKKDGRLESDPEIATIISKVIEILDNTEGINYSSFSQFFMVYNSAYSEYCELPYLQKRQFVYQMLCLYSEERHSMYLSHGYSDIVLQVLSDNYSHKRNSKATIVKIEDALRNQGVVRKNEFRNGFKESGNYYFLPDKGDKKLYERFKKEFSLEAKALKQEQNKLPDMVITLGDSLFVVEAKMMKGSGGGQDKQLVEVINFIRYAEKNPKIHYLVYFDGSYSNLLFDEHRSPKLEVQYQDIVRCLTANPQNFFVNHAGFEKLLSEILSDVTQKAA